MTQLHLMVSLGLLVCGLMVVSINLGSSPISLLDLLDAERLEAVELVLVQIRLPRTLIAALAGASFGICGAACQAPKTRIKLKMIIHFIHR